MIGLCASCSFQICVRVFWPHGLGQTPTRWFSPCQLQPVQNSVLIQSNLSIPRTVFPAYSLLNSQRQFIQVRLVVFRLYITLHLRFRPENSCIVKLYTVQIDALRQGGDNSIFGIPAKTLIALVFWKSINQPSSQTCLEKHNSKIDRH